MILHPLMRSAAARLVVARSRWRLPPGEQKWLPAQICLSVNGFTSETLSDCFMLPLMK